MFARMFEDRYILSSKLKMARRLSMAGGKAQNLAALSLAGFAVPEFFVISTRAFFRRARIDRKRLRAVMQDRIKEDLFAGAHIGPLAVRSSSPLEDHQRHSFAGHFNSFLDVNGGDELISAVERIWASAEKAHVHTYAQVFAVEQPAAVAVIVQKMLRPVVSGVMFTADPVANSTDMLRIEIVEGSCDKLVSGIAAPVSVSYDKKTQQLSIQEIHRDAQVLREFVENSAHLFELANIAEAVEHLFKSPQDIEWAFDGTQIWVLQSRPVSTLEPDGAAVYLEKNGSVWSNYFFAERFVEPLSPLGWSLIQPGIRKNALQAPLWYLGCDKEAAAVRLKLIDGLPHTQLWAFQQLYEFIPPSFISLDKKKTLRLTHKNARPLKPVNMAALFVRLLFGDFMWFPAYNLYRWKNFARATQQKNKTARQQLQKADWQTSLAILQLSCQWSDAFLAIHRWSITFADIFSVLLLKFLKLARVDESITVDHLLAGLPGNATVEANKRLLRLDVADKSAVARFAAEFGHRSESLDIACKTWGDDVEHIKAMSQMLKKNSGAVLRTLAQNSRLRQQAEHKARVALKNYIFPFNLLLRAIFDFLRYYALQFALLRENQRDLWHKILQTSRESILNGGRCLCEEGKIKQAEDVFYLYLHEFLQLFHTKPKTVELQQKIRRRRNYRKNLLEMIAHNLAEHKHHAEAAGHRRLRGIGVSQGKQQGRARIAMNYGEAMQGRHGDILVVPSADPAWSPIFGVISGLVMERGGVLSHASIVAREFRLPTVTNVSAATSKIKNDDLVEIDGQTGDVTILSQEHRGVASA